MWKLYHMLMIPRRAASPAVAWAWLCLPRQVLSPDQAAAFTTSLPDRRSHL